MDSLSDGHAESLYDLFNNSCQNFPDNTAILHDAGEHLDVIKYAELMSELEKLSLCLSQFCGNCTYIGMCVRNLHLAPTVILGIWRVRKAYVAVGRDARLLRRLGCGWLVAERGAAWRGSRLRARLRLHGRPLGLWEVRVAPRAPGPLRLAYAVRTSGSTGRAAAVQVPHAAILPNITDLRRELRMEPSDVVLLAAPLTFDPSVVEMFLALSSGAALKVVAPTVHCHPRRLLRGVTVLQATPSVLGHWLGEHDTLPSHLRALLLGGEPCPPLPVLARWVRGCTRCQVFNVYGLTEVSCWASVQRVRWDDHVAGVPLGAPLSHTLLCVRDTAGRPVTHGEGSLFVGSLERTCFVGDEEPRVLTEPVFRATGDIVQVDGPSGSVLYAGRADRRVKRWGERVDLDAVEREVRRWRADARCRCVWDDRSHRLGLFLLGDARWQSRARDVQWHLARHLPPAALPDAVRVLPCWPLSFHGKVDDAALKRSLREGDRREVDVEGTFASLWLEYLGPKEPAANDSFTRCGGNSFVALQLASELERLCGQPAPAQLLPLLLGGATFQECRAHVRKLGGTAAPEADSGETGLPRPAGGSTASQADSGALAGGSTASQADSGALAGGSERLCMSSCRGRTTVHCGDCEPERPALRDGRPRLEVSWKTSLGRCVDASPLVAQYCSGRELVVVGGHSHRLAALDGHTGTIVWQVDLPDRIESSVCISPSGTLGVVGCYDGGVYCLRLDTGTKVWRFLTSQMVKSSPSLCQDGSAVAVGSYDHHLYCLRLEDGAVCWRVSLGASMLASPLLEPCSGLVLAAALDGTCVAVSQRDGGLRWKHRLAHPVFSSPVLLSSGRALFAEVSGRLLCVEAATGDQVWSLMLGGNVFSSPCVLDTAVLLGCQDGCVYRVEDTGSVCWQTRLDSPVVATPCRLPGERRAVVVASSGSAYLLELQSGAVQCCQRLPHEVFSSPAACDPRRVCVGCRDDHVYCLDVQ